MTIADTIAKIEALDIVASVNVWKGKRAYINLTGCEKRFRGDATHQLYIDMETGELIDRLGKGTTSRDFDEQREQLATAVANFEDDATVEDDTSNTHAERTNRIADAFLSQIEAAAAAHPDMTERRDALVDAVKARRDDLIANANTRTGDGRGTVWADMDDNVIDREIQAAARDAQAVCLA